MYTTCIVQMIHLILDQFMSRKVELECSGGSNLIEWSGFQMVGTIAIAKAQTLKN